LYALRGAARNITFNVFNAYNTNTLEAWVTLKYGSESYSYSLSDKFVIDSSIAVLNFLVDFPSSASAGVYNLTLVVMDNTINKTYYLDDYLKLDALDVKIVRVDSPKIASPGDVINFTINFRNSGTITISDNAVVAVSEQTTGTYSTGTLKEEVSPGESGVYDQSFLITGAYEVITFYPSMLIQFENDTYGGLLTLNITPEYPAFNVSGPRYVDKYSSTVFNITATNLEGDSIMAENCNVTFYQILDNDVISAFKVSIGTISESKLWTFTPSDYNVDCGAYVLSVEGVWNDVAGDSGSRLVIGGCVS